MLWFVVLPNNSNHITMNITINKKDSIFQTIGRTEDFKPVLFFKIGQLKRAKLDLIEYFAHKEINAFFALHLPLDEQESERCILAIFERAKVKAMEVINHVIGKDDNEPVIYNNRFFTFLPKL